MGHADALLGWKPIAGWHPVRARKTKEAHYTKEAWAAKVAELFDDDEWKEVAAKASIELGISALQRNVKKLAQSLIKRQLVGLPGGFSPAEE
jgi:hypothetical protein